jgi:phosphotransferase system HPr (HPr) family protein
MTVTAKAVIRNAAGIHCRPTAVIVKEARIFDTETISVIAPSGVHANPVSAIELLSLGLDQGAEVTIEVSGEQAEACCAKMVQLFETNFDFPPRAQPSPIE